MKEIAEKIIIENRTSRQTEDILIYVFSVLHAGKISNNGKQYCFHSYWELSKTHVSVLQNGKSFRFVVYEEG